MKRRWKEQTFQQPRTIAALGTFTGRIGRAYLPSRVTVSRVELALAYGAPQQTNQFQNTRVAISPSITFHDHMPVPAAPRETARIRQTGRGLSEAEAAKLFERLFSRRERATALTGGTPQSQASSGDIKGMPLKRGDFPSAAAEGIERVLFRHRRPEQAESPERSSKAAAPGTSDADTGWGSPITPPVTPKPFTLPPTEVKRVTEEVIRAIDHRIIARRERMGRR